MKRANSKPHGNTSEGLPCDNSKAVGKSPFKSLASSKNISRRGILGGLIALMGGIASASPIPSIKKFVKNTLVSAKFPSGYNPLEHRWLMAIDIDQCIGCGHCVEACKEENHVPKGEHYFRTWIERYIIKKPKPGSGDARGEVVIDSPNGGIDGFPKSAIPREEIQKAFFVPKLCNLCVDSPCTRSCPVGATFDTPDGVVLVDPDYCIGCGFCIQACPYGCRFLNPETNTAEKCTLCYHRITRGLKPACVEVCPTQARIFGDLKNAEADDPIQKFINEKKVHTLKPHLGTHPRVTYAGMDKEVG